MRFTNLKSLLVTSCSVAALAAGAAAQAAPTQENFQYVTTEGNYNLQPSQSEIVEVFLSEVPSGASNLIKANGGLFGAGFSVTRASGEATLTAIDGSEASSLSNSFGGDTFKPGSGNSTTFRDGVDEVPPTATSGPLPGANGLIYLGSVTIQAGATPGDVTSFQLAAYDRGHGGYNETFNPSANPYDLDIAHSGTKWAYAAASGSTFTVTTLPTPEPAGLPLLAVGGLASLALLKRRPRPRVSA